MNRRRVVIDELEFEVPYGKLAAKTWHEETEESKRVLLLHGWMDNAGSFDNLVPKLKYKDGLYLVALDLPGHGKSSQLPPGSSYSDLNNVMEIRRCLVELEWIQPVPKKLINGDHGSPKPGGGRMISSASQNSIASMNTDTPGKAPQKKFTIIAHSLGAGLATFYASLYPNDVEGVVLLDFIKARTPPINELLQDTAETIDQFIKTVPSQSPFSSPVLSKSSSSSSPRQADKGQVVVSQETAIIATIEAHKLLGVLTRDDAQCLLKRSTVAVSTPPNSVIYSRDLRLQSMMNLRENFEIQKVMFNRVSCHVLIIAGKHGMYADEEFYRDKMDEMEQFYRERAKSLHICWLDGDHYLHMNRPEETAELINSWLDDPAASNVQVK